MDRIALCIVLGYFIGSIPTAYLLVRWKSRLDIRTAGSGNVGTLNSYQVSKSWLVGGVVLVVDVLKGAGATLLGAAITGGTMFFAALAGLAAILGHNYPVWLRFHGGRGLAPALGTALVVCWPIAPVWVALWLVAYALLRSVNPANALASGILACSAMAVPPWVFEVQGSGVDAAVLRWYTVVMMILILLRHIEPVKEFITAQAKGRGGSQ